MFPVKWLTELPGKCRDMSVHKRVIRVLGRWLMPWPVFTISTITPLAPAVTRKTPWPVISSSMIAGNTRDLYYVRFNTEPGVCCCCINTKVGIRYVGRWVSWGVFPHHTVCLPRCSFSQRFLTRSRSISLSPSQNKSEPKVVGMVPSFWRVGQTELSA